MHILNLKGLCLEGAHPDPTHKDGGFRIFGLKLDPYLKTLPEIVGVGLAINRDIFKGNVEFKNRITDLFEENLESKNCITAQAKLPLK